MQSRAGLAFWRFIVVCAICAIGAGLWITYKQVIELQETNKQIATGQKNFVNILADKSGVPRDVNNVSMKQAAAAMQAKELGDIELERKDFEKAFAYYVNGVNHHPGNLELVKGVFTTAERSQNPILMRQAQSVLEVSVYQVTAEDMDGLVDMLESLRKIQDSISEVTEPTIEEIKEEANKLISEEKVEKNWLDPVKISEVMSSLEGVREQLSVTGSENALIDQIKIQIDQYALVSPIAPICIHLNSCIENLEEETKKTAPSLPYVEAVLMSANGALQQLLGIDQSKLPDYITKEINEYPNTINIISETVREKISKSYYDESILIFTSGIKKQTKKHTETIIALVSDIKDVDNISKNILYAKYMEEIKKKIDEAKTQIEELQIKRYEAYQKRVLQLCQMAMEKADQRFFTDKDAIEIFNKFSLDEIDSRLLTPDVSRVYEHILQKVLGELNPEKRFKLEGQMVLAKKMTLEDF